MSLTGHRKKLAGFWENYDKVILPNGALASYSSYLLLVVSTKLNRTSYNETVAHSFTASRTISSRALNYSLHV